MLKYNFYPIVLRIRLNADIDLDIPNDCIRLDQYCATLSHKVNHSNQPNMEWVLVEHPRFGLIRGLASTRDIKKDEEILVNYHMNLGDAPEWFQKGSRNARLLKIIFSVLLKKAWLAFFSPYFLSFVYCNKYAISNQVFCSIFYYYINQAIHLLTSLGLVETSERGKKVGRRVHHEAAHQVQGEHV